MVVCFYGIRSIDLNSNSVSFFREFAPSFVGLSFLVV